MPKAAQRPLQAYSGHLIFTLPGHLNLALKVSEVLSTFLRPPGRFRRLSPARSQKTDADNFVHMHGYAAGHAGWRFIRKNPTGTLFPGVYSPETWH